MREDERRARRLRDGTPSSNARRCSRRARHDRHGRTDRQIADELFISKKTVSVHVSNILRKVDAGSRVEAAEIGQRAGLE